MTDASSSKTGPDQQNPAYHSRMRNVLKHAHKLLCASVDFVYPPACLLCGRNDEFNKHDACFCAPCRLQILGNSTNQCEKCAAPVGPYVSTEKGCQHCRSVRLKFEKVIRLGVYEGAMQEAILRGKQPHADHLIGGLAELLLEEHFSEFHAGEFQTIIPVPEFWTRRITRTANPAETVARAIARHLEQPCATQAVIKTRRTGTQKSLSAIERRRNVKDAFRVRFPDDIRGRRVLLVDDVMTTGVTANEITRVLKQAGASQVTLAVIARVLTTR